MENFIEMILSLKRNELDPAMRESHALLCQTAISFIRDAADFIVAVQQARSTGLAEQWEASKAACRAQRAVVEQAVTNAGSVEAQIPELHRIYGEARLAVQNFQPSATYDPYSSAADLEAVRVHREELEAAVIVAAENLRRIEQQLIMSRGWVSFEESKLSDLAEAEKALRVKVTMAADPDAQTFNSFGLSSGRPPSVQLADFGLSASE
jgi:hypothetical protein